MARDLRRHVMVGSRGRVGAAGDNAAMESFWSLLQTNVLNQQRWTSRQELRLAIVVWIERKYHRQRAQDTLGGLPPIEFEAKLGVMSRQVVESADGCGSDCGEVPVMIVGV